MNPVFRIFEPYWDTAQQESSFRAVAEIRADTMEFHGQYVVFYDTLGVAKAGWPADSLHHVERGYE